MLIQKKSFFRILPAAAIGAFLACAPGPASAYVSDIATASGKGQNRDLALEAKILYKEAVAHYKAGLFAEAQEKFAEVERIFPGYKATHQYLARLKKQLGDPAEPQEDPRIKAFSDELRREKDAFRSLEDEQAPPAEDAEQELSREAPLRAIDPDVETSAQSPDISIPPPDPVREEMRQRQQDLNKERNSIHQDLDMGLQAVYERATGLIAAGHSQEALDLFEEIEDLSPNYRQTRQYLKNLGRTGGPASLAASAASDEASGSAGSGRGSNASLSSEDLEDRYSYAVYLFRKNNFAKAQEAFEEVAAADPDYKLTQRYFGLLSARGIKPAPASAGKLRKKSPPADGSSSAGGFFKRSLSGIKNFFHGGEKKADEKSSLTEPGAVRPSPKRSDVSPTPWAEESPSAKDRVNPKVEKYYKKALELFLAKRYPAAQKLFLKVEKLSPGYKNTRYYLERIDQLQ